MLEIIKVYYNLCDQRFEIDFSFNMSLNDLNGFNTLYFLICLLMAVHLTQIFKLNLLKFVKLYLS